MTLKKNKKKKEHGEILLRDLGNRNFDHLLNKQRMLFTHAKRCSFIQMKDALFVQEVPLLLVFSHVSCTKAFRYMKKHRAK